MGDAKGGDGCPRWRCDSSRGDPDGATRPASLALLAARPSRLSRTLPEADLTARMLRMIEEHADEELVLPLVGTLRRVLGRRFLVAMDRLATRAYESAGATASESRAPTAHDPERDTRHIHFDAILGAMNSEALGR